MIVGPTGAGKSRAIQSLREAKILPPPPTPPAWPDDKAIISAIADSPLVRASVEAKKAAWAEPKEATAFKKGVSQDDAASAPWIAIDRLSSVGLNALPVWLKPYNALSNGQRARADVALGLTSGVAIDDFGSTVDMRNASVCAAGIARMASKAKGLDLERVVVASVHEGVVPWTGADWAYFPHKGELLLNPKPGGRPIVRVSVRPDDETDHDYVKSAAYQSEKADALPPVIGAPPLTTKILKSSIFAGKGRKLTSNVIQDEATSAANAAFEVEFDGCEAFDEPMLPPLGEWKIGLLCGPSGSGKSTVLHQLINEHGLGCDSKGLGGEGDEPDPGAWPADDPAASALPSRSNAHEFGGERLAASAATRRFDELSRGERTVMALARLCTSVESISEGRNLATADEFTSFLSRGAAMKTAAAVGNAWRRRTDGGKLVCATVHADVLHQLKPDWSFDPVNRTLTKYTWAPDEEDVSSQPESSSASAVTPAPATLFAPPQMDVVVRRSHLAGKEWKRKIRGEPSRFATEETYAALQSGGGGVEKEVEQFLEEEGFKELLEGIAELDDEDAEVYRFDKTDTIDESSGRRYERQNEEGRKHMMHLWETLFKRHHYMSGSLTTNAEAFIARWNGLPIGFDAVAPTPGVREAGKSYDETANMWRETRVVLLPEYQGVGVGSRLSDAVARHNLTIRHFLIRFMSRTAHPRFGAYRESSSKWKPTNNNGKCNKTDMFGTKLDKTRLSFSHEFVGDEREQRLKQVAAEHVIRLSQICAPAVQPADRAVKAAEVAEEAKKAAEKCTKKKEVEKAKEEAMKAQKAAEEASEAAELAAKEAPKCDLRQGGPVLGKARWAAERAQHAKADAAKAAKAAVATAEFLGATGLSGGSSSSSAGGKRPLGKEAGGGPASNKKKTTTSAKSPAKGGGIAAFFTKPSGGGSATTPNTAASAESAPASSSVSPVVPIVMDVVEDID